MSTWIQNIWIQRGIGLIIGLVIGIIIYLVISSIIERRDTSPNSNPTDSHSGSEDKTSSTQGGGFFYSAYKFLGFVAACLLLFVVSFCVYKAYRWWITPSQQKQIYVPAPGTLVLESTCWTPCSANLQPHPTKIRTDGDPLWIKYQGVQHWSPHPGKGAVEFPPGVEVGETKFVSRDSSDTIEGKEDSKNPHVQVWVYRIY